MKSASNGGVLSGKLQVLHVHVFFVAPLGTSHVAQPGTNQYEGRVAVWETAHYLSAAANLPVQPLNDIVGTDASPVFAGKITVSKRLLNAILYLLGSLFQFHGTEFRHHNFSFLSGSFLALLGMDRLKHFGYQLYLGARRDREYITVKVDRTPLWYLASGNTSPTASNMPRHLSPTMKLYTVQATAAKPLEEADLTGFILFHALSSA